MATSSTKNYAFGEFEMDISRRILSFGQSQVTLNAKAFDLLAYLVENPGRTVSKDEILSEVWKDQFVEEGNLSVQVSHLRKALGENPSEARFIATIPGKGYQFVGDVRPIDPNLPNPERNRADSHLSTRRSILLATAGALLVGTLALAIWYFSGPNGGNDEISSIAVLPFMSQTADDEVLAYLSEGLAESIILDLSRSRTLRVMSRDSSFKYRPGVTDPSGFGKSLGVSAVLSGRLGRIGDSISVRTELVSTADGSVIWGNELVRKADDVEQIHADISRAIAHDLRLRLEAGLSAAKTEDHEAYRLYILGRHHMNRLTDDGFKKARDSFLAAIDKDPAYGLAYVGLADSYNYLAGWGAIAPNDGFPLAKAAAVRAIELDPTLSEAYSSLGVVRLFYDLDFPGSEAAFAEAVRLNPNNAEAHHMSGYAYMIQGRFEEARKAIERSIALDPLSLLKVVAIGNSFAYERNFDAALVEYRKALEMDANSGLARWSVGNVLIYKGQYSDAIAELERAIQLSGDSPDEPASLAVAYARIGRSDDARAILQKLKADRSTHVGAATLAIIHGALGEKREALELLDQAIRERDALVPFMKVDPLFDPLRSEPRFGEMLSRAGFR